MDTVSPTVRSRVMAQVKSHGNRSTEVAFIALMRHHKIRGWHRNLPLPGRPDFAFPRSRLAIFVDGCFWHGCKRHCRIPHTRRRYWVEKIERNQKRARQVNSDLRCSGWIVLRFWEHELAATCNTEKINRMKRIVQQSHGTLRRARGGLAEVHA